MSEAVQTKKHFQAIRRNKCRQSISLSFQFFGFISQQRCACDLVRFSHNNTWSGIRERSVSHHKHNFMLGNCVFFLGLLCVVFGHEFLSRAPRMRALNDHVLCEPKARPQSMTMVDTKIIKKM